MKFFKVFGLVAVAVGWITIITSIIVNPWFSIFRNALSDLGALGLETRIVFNTGIFAASVLGILYSIYLMTCLRSRLGAASSSIFLIGAIHLTLVSLFPEGTYPHRFVSYEFFILVGVAVFLIGFSLIVEGGRTWGLLSILLSIIGFTSAFIVPWPSVGLLEVFAITLLTAWLVLMFLYHLRCEG